MKKLIICLSLIASMAFVGCSSKKDFVYLADMVTEQGYPVNFQNQPKIQRDDRLKITVSCKNPELALPFNRGGGSVSVSADGTVRNASGNNDDGYRVNAYGDIDFPILGELHLGGMTLQEATEYIRSRIIEGNYIKDPLVTVDFLNFHYTVLGAVGGNGTYAVDGDRVTILEAIAKAGDLTSKADMGGITVIREEDNQRKAYVLDIRDTDIFGSPCYYLQQNDIVYVRPKFAKKDNEDRTMQWVTVALSAITAACSVTWAIRR